MLDEGEEKYGLNWHGKKKAQQIALTPSMGTLLPCPEESVDWDTTQNLFIEGDNLEVLKLLQRSYANKIKLIYIDPPYNTGKEFVYPDNYQDNLDTYLKYTGQKGEEGLKLTSNTETSGRKHTNWLNMMYPRLKVAKSLLSKDGVIAVSIDDNELTRLCALCDEIFGESNRKVIAVKMSEPSGLKMGAVKKKGTIPKLKEYLILIKLDGIHGFNFELVPKEKWDSEYNIFVEGMEREHKRIIDQVQLEAVVSEKEVKKLDQLCESWKLVSVSDKMNQLGIKSSDKNTWLRENSFRICQATTSGSVLRLAKEKKVLCARDLFFVASAKKEIAYFVRATFSDEVAKPRLQLIFAEDNLSTHPCDLWVDIKTTGLDGEGYVDFKNGKKPLKLLERVVSASVSDGDIVMDFFAGSGSMGEAVWRTINSKNKQLSFLLVQLPEILDPSNDEQKTSYEFCVKNKLPPIVSELTKWRLRKASATFSEQAGDGVVGNKGFKVFKLANSNIRAWNPDRTDLEETLLSHQEHVLEGRTEQDLLYELLLKRGVNLAVPIETREVAGKTIYSIGAGVLFACLDPSLDRNEIETVAEGILAWQKELDPEADTHVFFRDSAFNNDNVAKTNMVAILEQNGITHVRSL